MAAFLHNGPCHRCGSRDNLATYDDGSQWCWGCHYYKPPQISAFVTQKKKEESVEGTNSNIILPADLSTNFPPQVLEYVGKYGITVEELIRNDYSYSHKQQSLVRSYRGNSGDAKQRANGFESISRLLQTKRVKKFTGSKEDCNTICRAKHPRKAGLVLVEDSLSSIKVARVCDSMALLGTNLPMLKLMQIEKLYDKVWVWLDKDKFKEAWDIATRIKWMGIQTQVILTDLDPKEYDGDFILEKLT